MHFPLAFTRLPKGLGPWPKKGWWTALVHFYSKYIKGENFIKDHHLKINKSSFEGHINEN